MTESLNLHAAEETLESVNTRRHNPYPAYRPSGIEWIGDVPEHWDVKRLKFLSQINPSASEIEDLRDEDEVSFVPMEAVGEYGGMRLDAIKRLDEVKSGFTYFRDEDVVVAKITPCFENGKGSIAENLINGVAFGTTELHVVRSRHSLDDTFLFYFTISDAFRRLGASEMYGAGGQKRVPTDFVRDFRVGVPPLEEQQKIARFLNERTEKIDELIEAKRDLLALLREKQQAVITHTVTKGLDPAAKLKPSGEEWLGDVPEHWEPKKLGYLVNMRGGSTPSKDNEDFWRGDIPWVSPKDMKSLVIDKSEDHVSRSALEQTNLGLLDPPAVLMVVRGMILAHSFPVGITTVPVTINQDMKALTPRGRISSEYLLHLLNGISKVVLGAVHDSAHGTKVLRISLWKHIAVYLPDEQEQKEICDYINTAHDTYDRIIVEVQTAIDSLREYRTSLISAAVTGKIDVREEWAW